MTPTEGALREEFIPHLAGFGYNGWVRVGNAATYQRQNDLMGELVRCLETLLTDPRIVDEDSGRFTPLSQRLVEEAIEAAPTKDTSIWEFRSHHNVYTFSRAMCWVAIDRGASLAHRLGRMDLAEKWRPIAAIEVFERVTRHANPVGLFSEDIDPETGALLGNFPQAYTHVGLIHAAMTMGELIEARDGRARAWT